MLSAFVWFAGKWSNPFELPARTWLFRGLSGLATGASWVCYFRALQLGEASKVAPVDKISLVLVAIFAFTFLGERSSVRESAGIAMVAGGVMVLALKLCLLPVLNGTDMGKRGHHSVYVVELSKDVPREAKFVRCNPGYIKGKPCVYVG